MIKRKPITSAIALVMALVICASLTGCQKIGGKTEGEDAKATATPATSATPEASVTPEPSATPTPAPLKVTLQYENEEATTLSFMAGDVFQLEAVASDGSTGGTWASSNTDAATVDANGVVSCWKSGSPKITYTLGEASATCTLTITEPTVKICFGTAVKADLTLNATWGFSIQLTAQVTPEGSTVTWSADDATVVSVTQDGLVSALKQGTTNVRCKCGTATATCIIRVVGTPPTGATATPVANATPDPNDTTPRVVITYRGVPNSDFTVYIDATVDMDYALYNVTGSQEITWSIKDTSIATVDVNGVVKGVKVGNTTLVCTCGTLTCETIVRVTKAP